jgi:hypothetical protein
MLHFVKLQLPIVLCFSAFAFQAGCGSGTNPDNALAKANEMNLQRVSNLYLSYQTANNWVGPADEAKFKEYVKTLSPEKLARIGIDPAAIDQIFISERDSMPFTIRYSVVGNMMGSREPVVFETEGVGGKRMVGFLDMSVREVDAGEYDQLLAGKAPAESAHTRQ